MRIPLPYVLLLMIGTAAGAWWTRGTVGDGAAPGPETRGGPAAEAAGPGEDEQAMLAAHLRSRLDEARSALDLASAERDDLSKRNAALETELSALRKRLEALEARLAPVEAATGKTIAQVLASIDALKRNGITAFISPGATSQLVSDIRALGDQGLEAVVAMLDSEDENERFLAAKLLEDLGNPAAADALKAVAMGDASAMVANMASHAIALMDDPSVLPALRELAVNAPGEGARVNALFGLCKHGDPDGIRETLRFLEGGGSQPMKEALGAGVLVLSSERLMPVADEVVRRSRGSETILSRAVGYYRGVGTAAARSRLQDLLADPDLPAAVREAATAALQGW